MMTDDDDDMRDSGISPLEQALRDIAEDARTRIDPVQIEVRQPQRIANRVTLPAFNIQSTRADVQQIAEIEDLRASRLVSDAARLLLPASLERAFEATREQRGRAMRAETDLERQQQALENELVRSNRLFLEAGLQNLEDARMRTAGVSAIDARLAMIRQGRSVMNMDMMDEEMMPNNPSPPV